MVQESRVESSYCAVKTLADQAGNNFRRLLEEVELSGWLTTKEVQELRVEFLGRIVTSTSLLERPPEYDNNGNVLEIRRRTIRPNEAASGVDNKV